MEFNDIEFNLLISTTDLTHFNQWQPMISWWQFHRVLQLLLPTFRVLLKHCVAASSRKLATARAASDERCNKSLPATKFKRFLHTKCRI